MSGILAKIDRHETRISFVLLVGLLVALSCLLLLSIASFIVHVLVVIPALENIHGFDHAICQEWLPRLAGLVAGVGMLFLAGLAVGDWVLQTWRVRPALIKAFGSDRYWVSYITARQLADLVPFFWANLFVLVGALVAINWPGSVQWVLAAIGAVGVFFLLCVLTVPRKVPALVRFILGVIWLAIPMAITSFIETRWGNSNRWREYRNLPEKDRQHLQALAEMHGISSTGNAAFAAIALDFFHADRNRAIRQRQALDAHVVSAANHSRDSGRRL